MYQMILPVLALTVGAVVDTKTSAKPNIVLIMADDLGWGDLGYHGGEAATPNIDRLSAEGIRFERFYAMHLCTPSRAALMTGRYAWRTGMASGVILNHLHYGLPLDETTMGTVMKNAGYATYIVGKWHLGNETADYLPTERGFDYHYGLYIAIDHFTHRWGPSLDWHRNRKLVREKGYATDLLGEDCVHIIEEHDFRKKPLFLYHAMFAVHAPNQAPEKYTALYSHVENEKRRNLLGLCSAMDYQVGQIVQALEKAGQLDNTLVFFLADNGGNDERAAADNGPLRDGKGSFYDGGVRVPAFATWPGRIKGGQISDALVHITDLLPTFAKLGGAPLPEKPLDGFDLGPVLFEGAETSGRKEIIFTLNDTGSRLCSGALIEWPWKLYRTKQGNSFRCELFNLETDPYEKEDAVQNAAQHPELTQRLNQRLDNLIPSAPPALWKMGDQKPPEGWKAPPYVGPDGD